jgi:hypothetical protein
MHFANVIEGLRMTKIYMELMNMKQEEIKRVEMYYERI